MFGELGKVGLSNRNTYSLEGDDRIALSLLRDVLNKTFPVFYVDIGSNHPIDANNTFLFYELGHRGVCIDPLPSLAPLYSKLRPNDLFIESPIGEKDEKLQMSIYDDNSASSCDQATQQRYDSKFKKLASKEVVCSPLDQVLENFSLPTSSKA